MTSSTIAPKAALKALSGTTPWQLDAAHVNVEFAARHLMISTVRGRFTTVAGTVTPNPAQPSASRVEIQIQAASVDTHQEQRDTHLRSADFLDVANFPAITFVSQRVDGDPTGEFKLVGDLTIRGTTRSVVLTVESQGVVLDPWGNERAGFSATTKISRKDFGLTWNQVLEAGGVAVGDEVKISIDAEFTRPVSTPGAA